MSYKTRSPWKYIKYNYYHCERNWKVYFYFYYHVKLSWSYLSGHQLISLQVQRKCSYCWLLWHSGKKCMALFYDSDFYMIAERYLCVQFLCLLRIHQLQKKKKYSNKKNKFIFQKFQNGWMQSGDICSYWLLLIYIGIASFPIIVFFIYDVFSAFTSCCVTASNLVLKCTMTRSHESRSLK